MASVLTTRQENESESLGGICSTCIVMIRTIVDSEMLICCCRF